MNGWVGSGRNVLAEACKVAFSAEDWEPAWNMINDVFRFLPVLADIDKSVICVHGGLSAKMGSLEKLEQLCCETHRPFDIKKGTVFYGLTWNDLDYDSVSPNAGTSFFPLPRCHSSCVFLSSSPMQ